MSKITELIGVDRDIVFDSLRTAIATLVSLLVARLLKFPEYYWAPISTVVMLQSTINPRQVAWRRFVGTALGAAVGAVVATLVGRGVIIYGLGIFVCGVLAAILRSWNAYRVTAITFSIVVLISRGPAWVFAWHRFLEVSLGIAVALIATLITLPKEKAA